MVNDAGNKQLLKRLYCDDNDNDSCNKESPTPILVS